MPIFRPHPPLDYDETLDVVRQVFDRRRIVIEVYRRRGPVAFAGCAGWLNELRISEHGFWIRVGDKPAGIPEAAQSPAGFLIVSRATFLGAGEFASDPPGPLLIETDEFDAVIGGSVVPDWDKLRRSGGTAVDAGG